MRVLLFSGGVDSTCLAAIQPPDLLLTVDYGQVCAQGELRAAAFIASELHLRHEIVTAPLRGLGAGDLAGHAVTMASAVSETWPYRNQMLITLAVMRYEREGLNELIVGTVKSDEAHPDGTATFIDGINAAVRAQNPDIRVTAPGISMSSLDLALSSNVSKDLLGWAFSCHRGDIACGRCRGCNKTFELLCALDQWPLSDKNIVGVSS